MSVLTFEGEPVEVLDLAGTAVLVLRLGPCDTAAGWDSRTTLAYELARATDRPVVLLEDGARIERLSDEDLARVGLCRVDAP